MIFTDLQVAAVGLTLQAALDRGVAARAYDAPSSATAGGAFHGGGTPGTARIVVDEQRGVIVGAAFTGAEVAGRLHAATIVIVAKTPVELLWQAVPAFPTVHGPPAGHRSRPAWTGRGDHRHRIPDPQ